MPTIGTPAKPGGGWHSYQGSSYPNQEAEKLQMPARGRILEVGAWVGGWSGTCRVRLCIWDGSSKALLGQSNQITVANEGAGGPAGSNVALYTGPLIAPVEIGKGFDFYVGFARDPSDGHQVSEGASGTGPHFESRSGPTWPADLDHNPLTQETRRIGAYVANWETLPGAWVYRSGAWVEADTVQIYRSGSWVDVDGVSLYRSGSWADSE
jgi:hypothetical protein